MKPLKTHNHQFLMMFTMFIFFTGFAICQANAQSMGISSTSITPDASSILEMRTSTKGLLMPRLTTAERDAISSPATGLMLYNTTTGKFNFYNGSAWITMYSGTAGVNSVTGTTNRISLGGTAVDPTIDIASNYVGQNSITTLGTIGTGTWNGNTIGVGYGGTGITSYTIGDILYASTSTMLGKLAGVATGNALISGGVGTAPAWGKIGLTTHVSGTLPIANGGTNSTATPTNGGVIYGDGTAYKVSAAGIAGQVLQSTGAGAPVWVSGVTLTNSVVLGSDVVNNNVTANTMQDVTGLSFAVTAGVTYRFRALIMYTSAAITTGSRWAINGPSVGANGLAYLATYPNSSIANTTINAVTYDYPLTSNSVSPYTNGNIATIDGIIKPTANGTVIVRFASEISGSAITALAGSTLTWW